jgi:hypothetical protein
MCALSCCRTPILQGATTAAPGTINVPAAVVAAPTSESLLRTFELAATPSAEAQQDSNMLMGVLSNPQQFGEGGSPARAAWPPGARTLRRR